MTTFRSRFAIASSMTATEVDPGGSYRCPECAADWLRSAPWWPPENGHESMIGAA